MQPSLRPLLYQADRAAHYAVVYARSALRPDLIAGLTVAMIAVPQSMAYAQLAGLPPVIGLYSVIVPTIVGALAGSSSFLVSGASNASSLALAGVLAAFLAMPNYPEYAFMLAILSGLLRIGMGLLKMGAIMRYVSNSVLTGLLAAIGTLIIVNQLPSLLGIPRPASGSTIVILQALANGLGQINPYVLITGLLAMVVLHGTRVLARRTRRALPGALLAILIPALLVLAAGWHDLGVRTISDISPLDEAGLRFHLPSVPLGDMPALLVGALALSIFSLMEAINVAKAVSMQAGERISASREFFGQGLASLAGGFFQCMPSSGSPARTSVNFSGGARTRLAAAFSGLFVWLALLLFARPIGYIPNASLAGVLIISALGIVNRHQIVTTWKSGGVAQLVMLVTYLSAVFLPLQYAIYVGVLLSSLIYLYQSSQMNMHFLTRDAQGRFLEHPIKEITCIYPRMVLLNIEGPLFFGATEDLERQLMRIFSQGIRVIVMRMRRVQMLGSTGIIMLENLVGQAHRLGIHVYLSEVNEETMLALHGSGLEQIVGPERIFPESPALFDATEQALLAARPLAGEEGADS